MSTTLCRQPLTVDVAGFFGTGKYWEQIHFLIVFEKFVMICLRHVTRIWEQMLWSNLYYFGVQSCSPAVLSRWEPSTAFRTHHLPGWVSWHLHFYNQFRKLRQPCLQYPQLSMHAFLFCFPSKADMFHTLSLLIKPYIIMYYMIEFCCFLILYWSYRVSWLRRASGGAKPMHSTQCWIVPLNFKVSHGSCGGSLQP